MHEGREGRLAYATRDARDMGSDRLVLAQDEMPPDTHNTDLHFHSAREEAWYVRSGSGIARLGEQAHELRAGSFWFARENTGVGHRIEVGPEGMQLITMGDLIPGDVVRVSGETDLQARPRGRNPVLSATAPIRGPGRRRSRA